MTRAHIESAHAPKAIGPYSVGVWAGDLLYLSGQTPLDPATGQLVTGGIDAQTHRVFDNLEGALRDAGLTMDHVIKCNVYLVDMADFPAMNSAYEQRFSLPYPARTTVAVKALPREARVEIELIAKR